MTYRLASCSLFVLAMLAVACGPSIGPKHDDAGVGPAPIEITVQPVDQELVIDGSTPATSAYTATGRFEDGHTEDISDRVLFSLADGTLGSFAANQLTSTLTPAAARAWLPSSPACAARPV